MKEISVEEHDGRLVCFEEKKKKRIQVYKTVKGKVTFCRALLYRVTGHT